jgi:sarcosine oxidase subunit gamma
MSEVRDGFTFQRRSFVARKLEGSEFQNINDGAVMMNTLGRESSDQVEQPGLIDLSVAHRVGFRGANAAEHIQACGYPLPSAPNVCELSRNGELVLRLGETEFWVLSNAGDLKQEFNCQAITADRCYPLFCQNSHSWLMMVGPFLPEIMAKICGVDLSSSQFHVGQICQTSVARISAVIVHHEIDKKSVFSILSDSASAEYLWEALLDAMSEFNGLAMGASAIA